MELKIESLTHLRINAFVKLVLKKIYMKETMYVKNVLVIRENVSFNALKILFQM